MQPVTAEVPARAAQAPGQIPWRILLVTLFASTLSNMDQSISVTPCRG